MNRRDAMASLPAAAGTLLGPRVLRAQAGFPDRARAANFRAQWLGRVLINPVRCPLRSESDGITARHRNDAMGQKAT
jgi:hypothetical protein